MVRGSGRAVVPGAGLDHAPQRVLDVLPRERLRQHAVHAVHRRGLLAELHAPPRDEHDARVGRGGLRELREVPAVELRHAEVREHDVERVRAQRIRAGGTTVRGDHVHAELGEHLDQHLEHRGLIVHDEHPLPRQRARRAGLLGHRDRLRRGELEREHRAHARLARAADRAVVTVTMVVAVVDLDLAR